MKVVRYKGHVKKAMPVLFPIGSCSKGTIRAIRYADPEITLEDQEALDLVELDPYNFEIVGEPGVYEEKAASDPAVKPPMKRRGRRPKVEISLESPVEA